MFSVHKFCHLCTKATFVCSLHIVAYCFKTTKWEFMKLFGSSLGLLNSLSGRKRGQFFLSRKSVTSLFVKNLYFVLLTHF